MKFTVKTIGCKVNTYESNKIKQELVDNGFEFIEVANKEKYNSLDFYIVNTCSVTSIADKKSRQMINQAKRINPNVKVVAIGCLIDSMKIKNSLSEENTEVIPADILIDNKNKQDVAKILIDKYLSDKGEVENNKKKTTAKNTQVRAFIKIQDGCNQFCSYCIIPYLRGRIKSKEKEIVLSEIKEYAASGVKEIVLTGIHLSSYGIDFENKNYEETGAIKIAQKHLLDLLKDISKISEIERIRLGSLEPRIIDNDFFDYILEDELLKNKFCFNFCLSLQSGSDKILKLMNRHYTTKDYELSCKIIREKVPYATITTDVIVGFPGETLDDFNESLEFVKRMRFYNPNIFPYSRRKGTMADKFDNQLTKDEKHKRCKIMINECEKITKEIEAEYNKENHDILIEEIIEENGIKYGIGYTKEYIKKKIEIKETEDKCRESLEKIDFVQD